MLLPLLAVLCLMPMAWAGEAKCCTGEDRQIVLKQWDAAYNSRQSGTFKVILGKEIFKKFLEVEPGAAEPLARVKPSEPDSAAWKAHTIRVINGVDRSINLLDNPAALVKDLDHLAHQHENRPGVTKAQFNSMLGVLKELLPRVLPDYHADAWRSCLKLVINGITARLA